MLMRFILTILCVIFSSTSLAERWYEIEVILFEQANDERLLNEAWDNQPPLPELSKLRDIISQPAHLQRIENLCYQGNYYQVKTVPGVVEVIAADPVEPAEPQQDVEIQSEPQETLVIEKPFLLLADSEHELKDVYAQLRRRRGYRMLFHEAWRQPMQSKKEALPLRFYAGANYGAKFRYSGELLNPPETEVDDFSAMTNTSILNYEPSPVTELRYQNPTKYFRPTEPINGLMDFDRYFKMSEIQRARAALQRCGSVLAHAKNLAPQPVWQIDGFIKFYAERFRHIETNLVLRIPGTEEISLEAEVIEAALNEAEVITDLDEATNPTTTEDWQIDERLLTDDVAELTELREVLAHYTMQQNRRITDEKIHYFDHPLLGLIVQMRVYDPEEAAAEAIQP